MYASISVTTYNRKTLTNFCIKTIHERTPRDEYELIVVDNGSTDGTVEMLKAYKTSGIIDKLLLKHPNSLGLAINDAWANASPKADWLIVFSNDLFCMEGWFENLKLVIESELKPDYLFACLRMPGFKSMIPHKTLNGGCYTIKKGVWKLGHPFGGGLAIKKSLVKLHNIQFQTIPFSPRRISIYSAVCRRLYRLKLKFVALGKPCILMHDCDFANPKYKGYYQRRFGIPKAKKHKEIYRSVRGEEANRRLRKWTRLLKMGYITNPEEYYEGSGYEIGPYYRKALEALRK